MSLSSYMAKSEIMNIIKYYKLLRIKIINIAGIHRFSIMLIHIQLILQYFSVQVTIEG